MPALARFATGLDGSGMGTSNADGLNGFQKHHLLISCQYIDGLLADIEHVLSASQSKSVFPKYEPDVSPAQAKVIQDYIARIRAQILRVLAGQSISPPSPRFGSVHSIRVNLMFVDNALEELRPKYMRGYGEVAESVKSELNGLSTELQGLVGKLNTYLAQGLGKDLQARLIRLEQTSNEIGLLRLLERIIGEHGLVEFRESLSIILDRLEENVFEIALFGRVSSGKSSLLNYLLGAQVLPVGVNPITAVPTRVTYGERPKLSVWLAEKRPETASVERLSEFVSEEHNPANAKRVTRLVVELPAERLRAGVVFVDTPGLGSLATAGAAQTMAYLPRCDMGIVLLDAGSTLTQEDITTVQALYEAGVRTFVLLSKADLLSADDLARSLEYISGQFKHQLNVDIDVQPVSVRSEHRALLERWVDTSLAPLCERHKQLTEQSIRRKIGGLGESVAAALRIRLEKASGKCGAADPDRVRESELRLRKATGKFDAVRVVCEQVSDDIQKADDVALRYAGHRIVELGLGKQSSEREWTEAAQWAIQQATAEYAKDIHANLQDLVRTLHGSLKEAADALQQNDVPPKDEFLSVIKETPRLDLGDFTLDLHSAFRFAFGKSFTKKRLASVLREQIGQQVRRALGSYGHLLFSWTSQRIAELRSRFDAHADRYRAQFERLTAASQSDLPQRQAIERDLKAIDHFASHIGGATVVEEAR